MRAVSLFSGVGGFELGFQRAGIETVLQAERDPWALEVLARHWPETERVTDVRDVQPATSGTRGRRVQASSNGISLVYGGFPCQPFSVAGKRLGEGDERDGWPEFRRIVSELRPTWIVAENVPGLLSVAGGRYFGQIIADLVELGYGVAWGIRDAQFFGVPQRRRRLFIVATSSAVGRAGAERCAQVLSLCESCGGNPETGGAQGEGTTGALSAGTLRAGGVNGGNNTGGGYLADVVAGTLGGTSGGWSPDTDRMTFIAATISASAGHHGHSSPRGDGSDNLIAHALMASDAKGPLPEKSVGNAVAQNGVRRLTPRECERLMGWPDDHTRWTADGREIADSHRYRMAGNGVVATCAEWIGHRLVEVDAWPRTA
jgi:DNA (cytosine-5)-methyltransferase 1